MASLTLPFVFKPSEIVLRFLRKTGKQSQCIIDNHRTSLTYRKHTSLRTELGRVNASALVSGPSLFPGPQYPSGLL